MKNLIPSNIQELKAYVPGKTIAEVQKEYNPQRISKLASNENRLGRSPGIDKAVQQAMATVHDYPDPLSLKLRKELSKKHGLKPENFLFGAGSESLLAGLFRTFFLNKENVITSNSTFVGMYVQAKTRGVHVKKIPITKEYRFDVKAMVNAIDDLTKMIYIANPNNPTGTYITNQEFEWLMDNTPPNVLVVMDEAYYEYACDVNDYPDVLSYNHKNVIVLRTFSKGYGLAGFRVGYAIASQELIGYLHKTKLPFEPASLSQAAALAAYRDQEFLARSKKIVSEGKEILYQFFDEMDIQYAHSIANFVLIDLKDEDKAIHITQALLEKGVIVRRVNAFGLPTCVRVTIGLAEELEHFKTVFSEIY